MYTHNIVSVVNTRYYQNILQFKVVKFVVIIMFNNRMLLNHYKLVTRQFKYHYMEILTYTYRHVVVLKFSCYILGTYNYLYVL